MFRRCEQTLTRRKRCGEMLHVRTDPDIFETVCVFAWIGLSYTRNLGESADRKSIFLGSRSALQSGLRLRPQESQWKCLRFQKYSDSRGQGLNQNFIGLHKSWIIRRGYGSSSTTNVRYYFLSILWQRKKNLLAFKWTFGFSCCKCSKVLPRYC